MNKRTTFIMGTIALVLAAGLSANLLAQGNEPFQLLQFSNNSGGHRGNDRFNLTDSIGQPIIAAVSNDTYSITPGFHSSSSTVDSLVLLYVNADNDLVEFMPNLIQNAHIGMKETDAVVLMVLDGPNDNDSYLYRLSGRGDGNCKDLLVDHTCSGRYQEGQNFWRFSEDVGSPETLSQFVTNAINDYPNAERIILSVIGHGGGWSPNKLAGQPTRIGGQPDELGGLLWDYHSGLGTGTGSALSTDDLGNALNEVFDATGRKIDLLYLDACLMGMWEVGYELKRSVRYLLASESWSWTSFQYDKHLAKVKKELRIEDIGSAWINHEQAFLEDLKAPYTYSLMDLTQMDALSTAIDELAAQLSNTLPASKDKLTRAFFATDRFDSTQDEFYVIDGQDNYADLNHFAEQVEVEFSDNASILAAAGKVKSAIEASVVANQAKSGRLPPQYVQNDWTWENPGGISIYLPLNPAHDDWKRFYYEKLQASKIHSWDEFIDRFWGDVSAPASPECPVEDCDIPFGPLATGASLSNNLDLYLPLVSQ